MLRPLAGTGARQRGEDVLKLGPEPEATPRTSTRIGGGDSVDAVLASGITSIVGVIIGGGITMISTRWTTRQSEKQAREQRVYQRLAESYLEVLRLVEREGQWIEARIKNWAIEAAE